MSSSNTQINYGVSIDLERGGAQASATFTIPQELGLSDNDVLAFVQHLRDFTWPTGVYSAFTVNKTAQTTVAYITNLAATPPNFS